ncbi:MAG: TIGR02302 family protein [Rhizobiaceae bacterium]
MAIESSDGDKVIGFARRLAGTRIATRLAMTVERLWPLILPFLIIVSLFVSLSWLGLFRLLPESARLGLAVLFGLATLASLWPLRSYKKPTAAEIDRRIEGANLLEHTPVLVQTDRPGGKPDLFADALWREHQKRMAEKLRNLAGDMPRARVPERDPWGLRAVAPLLLLVALAFSYGPLGGRLTDAFTATPGMPPVPPRIDAWVTPPAYTGKPPIFLTAENNREAKAFTVPAGSDIALRVTGGAGNETLSYGDTAGTIRDIEPAAPAAKPDANAAQTSSAANMPLQFAGKLNTDGVLSLKSGETELQRWAFTVIPDEAPAIRFTDEPKRALNGTLELHYEIKDDYGAASAAADIALADKPDPNARPLYAAPELPLTLPRRDATPPVAKTSRDLTEHVWAGARIAMTLKATDAAKQEARSETKTFTLPQRTFTNPLAKAVVEQRRLLGLDANKKAWVLTLMDAITLRPEDTFDSMAHYLAIMSARTRLKMAQSDDELRGVADYLWQIALGIEDGELSTAEKRLKQAQEQLKQALERGASDEEIDKLMRELREAMNDYLREFAERAQKDPNMAQNMPQNGQELRQSDLEKMLDQIENLAKSGSRDEAQELLSQLEEMMNNLQAARPQQGEQGMQGEMRKQMNKLGEIMRRQQEMMNETFRMQRQQRGQQGEQGEQGEQQQGQNGEQGEQGQQGQQQGRPMTPEEFAEAMKQLQEGQGQLQGELEQLQEGLRGMGIQPGEGFGEAGKEMGEAEGALGDQQGDRATGHQGRALEALRKGAQDMMQQMQQAMQGDEGGSDQGGRQQQADRDPLGRPRATTGPDFGDTVKVPDEIDVQRARRILDAIRKRLGNALSPELERNYLERLLDMR